MQISDEIIERATDAYMKETGAEQHQLDGWFGQAIKAALEAALSTDAEPVSMDDEDRTPMPAGFDDALWRKADEVHHAMALVARDQECVKIIYAALSTHNAEPVKTAPAVAVKADLPERFEEWWAGRDSKGEKTLDYNQRKQLAWDAFYAAALSAQVQDVAEDPDALFWRIRIAYLRGAEWRDQTGSMELAEKASYDYADKITSPLAASPASKHGDAE